MAALRSDFEVLEGDDYETAYKLLQEASLDVLLLALPMESGELRECTELLNRLAGGDIGNLQARLVQSYYDCALDCERGRISYRR